MDKVKFVISLISHTNVGKTSLVRTLVKEDVGQVANQAHVTEMAESYPMIETADAAVEIWDTPGFGSVQPLLKRMKKEGSLAWLLHEVVDRLTNRALYCSVAAAKHVKKMSDVVAYLVPAEEPPEDAGYLENEMELLRILGKPVWVVLTHMGQHNAEHFEERIQAWKKALDQYPWIQGGLVLDAFFRHWKQEEQLLKLVLPEPLQGCLKAFSKRERNRIETASNQVAEFMSSIASWRETRQNRKDQEILESQTQQVNESLQLLSQQLCQVFKLDAEGKASIQTQMVDLEKGLFSPIDQKKASVWSSLVSGAAGGLAADLGMGGLSFGGGFVLGAIFGGLGGLGVAKTSQWLVGNKSIHWGQPFISQSFVLAIGIFMQVMHHGRAKGSLLLTQVKEQSPDLDMLDKIQEMAQTLAAIHMECGYPLDESKSEEYQKAVADLVMQSTEKYRAPLLYWEQGQEKVTEPS